MDSTAITDFCTQSSVLVIVGKGGVGKSTLSATVARLAARNGVSVLLVELESRRGPTGVFGDQLLTANEVELFAGDRDSQSAPIHARTITPDDALVEYLVDRGFGRANNLGKTPRIKAGSSDQCTIYVFLPHQLLYIVRLHASTILYADTVSSRAIGKRGKDRSDKRVGFLSLGRSRGSPRPNRPARPDVSAKADPQNCGACITSTETTRRRGPDRAPRCPCRLRPPRRWNSEEGRRRL